MSTILYSSIMPSVQENILTESEPRSDKVFLTGSVVRSSIVKHAELLTGYKTRRGIFNTSIPRSMAEWITIIATLVSVLNLICGGG